MSDESPTHLTTRAPPRKRVCGRRANRYYDGQRFEELAAAIQEMNRKRRSAILRYDGRTGEKSYGEMLPDDLHLTHIEVEAGVSSQATLLGRTAQTIESLYVSPALVKRIGITHIERAQPAKQAQLSLF